MAVAFGKSVIDTGPCSDPTNNFRELADILEALGNPYLPDPGDEVVDNPWGGANFTEGCGIEITATPGEYNIATKRKEGGGVLCDTDGLYIEAAPPGQEYTGIGAIDITDYVVSSLYVAGTNVTITVNAEGKYEINSIGGSGGYEAGDYISTGDLEIGVISVLASHIGLYVDLAP